MPEVVKNPGGELRIGRLNVLLTHADELRKDAEVYKQRFNEFSSGDRDFVNSALSDVQLKRWPLPVKTQTEVLILFSGGSEKLIEGIRETQIARLAAAAVRQDVRRAVEKAILLSRLVEELSPEEIKERIRKDEAEINFERIEAELRKIDLGRSDYLDNDLPSAQVVSAAKQQLL